MSIEQLTESKLDINPDFLPEKENNPLDIHEAVECLKAGVLQVDKRMVGRKKLLEQTLFTLMTGEHQLIYSRTGTAKSLYSKSVFNQFDGEVFSIQFRKGTTEESVVGAYDLDEFKKGKIWHRTEGSLVKADFAFLDEFMDANDMVLRSMLGILNEREFTNGQQHEKARLHSAIAVTNYLRQTEMSEAVMDRFLFQARLDPDTSALNQLLIDKSYEEFNGTASEPSQKMSVEIPRAIANVVKGKDKEQKISSPYSVLFLKNDIISNYITEAVKESSIRKEIYISPRTIAKSRDVLNASALLDHRNEVNATDLKSLRLVLTTISGQDAESANTEEKVFDAVLNKTIEEFSPESLDAVDKIMQINEYFQAWKDGKLVEAIKKNSWLDSFLRLLHLANWSDAKSQTFLGSLYDIRGKNEKVDNLKNELVERIKAHGERE